MATNTYVALDKALITGASTTSVLFTGISSAYTNLRAVISGGSDDAVAFPYVLINGATTGYSGTAMFAYPTPTTTSERSVNNTKLGNFSVAFTTSLSGLYTIDFFKANVTSNYRSQLWRMQCQDNTSGYAGTGLGVSMWRNNSDAISSLDFRLTLGGTDKVWKSGTTITLYGVTAEGTTPAPLATGGAIYSDADYYYHAFGSSGTFTPLSSLTADILVVGGGGGGGYDNGGGGGAGGIALYSSQSLTATGYSCTVGAGGGGSSSSASKGSTGGTSTFAGLTAKVGGGGGGSNISLAGATGASSGGGSGEASSGASGSATDGFAGAASNGTFTSNGSYNSGGGGGSAAAATQPGTATATGGSGGLGVSTYSTWLSATGLGKDGLIAGGGGGATLFNASTGSATGGVGSGGGGNGGAGNTATNFSNGTNGLYASGSGGGGGSRNVAGTFASGNGGSGVIIIRYLKA